MGSALLVCWFYSIENKAWHFVGTISPLHTNLQVVNFQRCKHACQPMYANCCTLNFLKYCTVGFTFKIFSCVCFYVCIICVKSTINLLRSVLYNQLCYFRACVCAKSHQSCQTLCDPMNCSLPGSSDHGILQARILEWVAMLSSRGSSQPRGWICISNISCTDRWVLYHLAPGKPC